MSAAIAILAQDVVNSRLAIWLVPCAWPARELVALVHDFAHRVRNSIMDLKMLERTSAK
jgi:hypothetical protein